MGGSDAGSAAGVVLAKGRTRVWVDGNELYWRRGRTTVTVPGARIRRVEVAGPSLAVGLFEDLQGLDAGADTGERDALVAGVDGRAETVRVEEDR